MFASFTYHSQASIKPCTQPGQEPDTTRKSLSIAKRWLLRFCFGRVFFFSLAVALSTGEDGYKEYVLTLDHSNFSETVTKHDFIVVEFYAPWCGHCQNLAPEDATANDIPSDTYDVEGFPTVYLRSASGKLVQYEGDRTKQDIIDFIEKNRDEVAQQDPAKDEL